MPPAILEAVDKVVEQRVSSAMLDLAADLRKDYSKIDDPARANEIETQLRQGLYHLAKRLNQGSNVEINVGVPLQPKDPKQEEPMLEADTQKLQATKDNIVRLSDIRKRARAASTMTTTLETGAPLLLIDEQVNDDDSKPA